MSSNNEIWAVEAIESRRLFTFGGLNSSFGTDGSVSVAAEPDASGVRSAIVLNGNILSVTNTGLYAFSTAGVPVRAFGKKGRAAVNLVSVSDLATDGVNSYVVGQDGRNVVIEKFGPTGMRDNSFGTGGVVSVYRFGSDPSIFFGAASLSASAQGIIVAGIDHQGDRSAIRVYKFRESGTADRTFGRHGVIEFNSIQPTRTNPLYAQFLAAANIDPKGVVTVNGGATVYSQPSIDSAFSVGRSIVYSARLTLTGVLDRTYGSNGLATAQLVTGSAFEREAPGKSDTLSDNPSAASFAGLINSDGSSVIAGQGARLGVAAFNRDGRTIFASSAPGGFMLNKPTSVAAIKGRFAIVGEPSYAYSGHGAVITSVNARGEFGQPVSADDLRSGTIDLSDGNTAGQTDRLSIVSNGKTIVVGGRNTAGSPQWTAFSSGSSTELDANFFANATKSSVVTDSAGMLHLAYYDAHAQELEYATRAITGRWSGTSVVSSIPLSGLYVSIDVDSENHPWIAYYDGTNFDLRVATSSDGGRSWSNQLVESKGITGLYPSIKVDRAGNGDIDIAYYRRTSKTLRFATSNGNGRWSTSQIESSQDVGANATLLIGDDLSHEFGDNYANVIAPKVFYDDSKNGVIKAATLQGNRTWVSEVVSPGETGVGALDAAFGPIDGPSAAVSYYMPRNADLKLATDEKSVGWRSFVLASRGAQGQANAIRFPIGGVTGGLPSIYSYNHNSDGVFLYDSAGDAVPEVGMGGREFALTYATLRSNDPDSQHADIAFLETSTEGIRVISVDPPFRSV